MALHVSPGRPLARLVVGAARGERPSRPGWHYPTYAPSSGGTAPTALPVAAPPPDDESYLDRVARMLVVGILDSLPDDSSQPADLEQAMDPDVVAWSPAFLTTSREQLVATIHGGDEDDTLTDVQVSILSSDVVGERVYTEWRLTGRFTNPCFVDDDLLIEPTGRLVETSGIQVTTFRGRQVVHLSCYYDDLAILEQLVTG